MDRCKERIVNQKFDFELGRGLEQAKLCRAGEILVSTRVHVGTKLICLSIKS